MLSFGGLSSHNAVSPAEVDTRQIPKHSLLLRLLSIGGAAIAGLFGALVGVAIGVIVALLTIGNTIVCLIGSVS